ncbi:MAG: type II toxin-antitoxin system RelE/ParE family toxin [Planctomycetes bacterium]|nr:type II toxin-antitoxin system RelE/ParE family toxin [Planctomycetota bacterium]
MKAWRARYTPEAADLIRKLHPESRRRIRGGIRALLDDPSSGHELQLELSGFRSLRVGAYRVLYRIDEDARSVEVLYVGPRRDVYENFRRLVAGEDPRGPNG